MFPFLPPLSTYHILQHLEDLATLLSTVLQHCLILKLTDFRNFIPFTVFIFRDIFNYDLLYTFLTLKPLYPSGLKKAIDILYVYIS